MRCLCGRASWSWKMSGDSLSSLILSDLIVRTSPAFSQLVANRRGPTQLRYVDKYRLSKANLGKAVEQLMDKESCPWGW